MDRLAAVGAGAGHGHSLFMSQKRKQPFRDHSVKSTSISTGVAQASLSCKKQEYRREHKKCYGSSSFLHALDAKLLSSSRCLASKVEDSSSSANNGSEDQVISCSSQNADLNSTSSRQNGRVSTASRSKRNHPKDVDSTAMTQTNSSNSSNPNSVSKLTSSSGNEYIPSIAKPNSSNLKKNGTASGFNGGAHSSRPCKDDEQNGGASVSTSLSPSEGETVLLDGPLKEMHSRVSGKHVFDNNEPSLSHLLASKNIIEFISRFPGWADAQKESGMPQRQQRAFYSHEDWLQHRSSLRYVRHMLSSVSSRVIVSLVPPVFTFTAGAIVVAVYNTAVNFSFIPSFLPLLHAASLPYELTAPALALLLVFRTDASYSRYDEARKTWTNVISTTKDFARQSAQLIKSPQDVALKSSLLSYIMAFPVSLKCRLIHGSDIRKDLQALLQDDDLAFILASHHRPNCLIQLMSQTLCLLRIENTERILLENHITQYTASVSTCERLIRTPIPLSYTRLTSRFLVLWHMALPIVLWDACNWLVVPATFFSAATLFCIEEVGVLIEEPFPMLALDKIIGIAHDNIRELMKRQQETEDFLSLKKQLLKN